jgi:hypothetical protein
MDVNMSEAGFDETWTESEDDGFILKLVSDLNK